MPQTPVPSASPQQQNTQTPSSQEPNGNAQEQVATIEAPPRNIQIPVVTCDFASDMSTSEAADQFENNAMYKDTLKVSPGGGGAGAQTGTINVRSTMLMTTTNGTGTTTTTMCTTTSTTTDVHSPRGRALSVGIDTDMVSEFDPSSSDSGVAPRCAVVKPLKFRLCQPIFGKRTGKSRKNEAQRQQQQHSHSSSGSKGGGGGGGNANNNQAGAAGELEPALPKKEKPRDPEKEKRRIARKKEKRATLILGLIMGSFIACWLPFFFLYILVPMCPNCVIPDSAFALAFWLGYMNSALNPAIYTIFNKDFRRAFRRILFK